MAVKKQGVWVRTLNGAYLNIANGNTIRIGDSNIIVFRSGNNTVDVSRCASLKEAEDIIMSLIESSGGLSTIIDNPTSNNANDLIDWEDLSDEEQKNKLETLVYDGYTSEYIANLLNITKSEIADLKKDVNSGAVQVTQADSENVTLDADVEIDSGEIDMGIISEPVVDVKDEVTS